MHPRRGWINVEWCSFVVVTSLLIVINDAVLLWLWEKLGRLGPSWMSSPKFIQVVSLVGSVLLVFAQWWAIERITALWLPPRTAEQKTSTRK